MVYTRKKKNGDAEDHISEEATRDEGEILEMKMPFSPRRIVM